MSDTGKEDLRVRMQMKIALKRWTTADHATWSEEASLEQLVEEVIPESARNGHGVLGPRDRTRTSTWPSAVC